MLLSIEVEHWLDWIPASDRRLQYALALGSMALFGFAHPPLLAGVPVRAAALAAGDGRRARAAVRGGGDAALGRGVALLLVDVPRARTRAAFVVLFAGWAIEVRRAGSLSAIADALAMRDALAQLNRGRDAHVLELVEAIEVKDVATLGHVSRVGAYALAIGKRDRRCRRRSCARSCSPRRCTTSARSACRTSILRKPASLTDDEYAEIKKHTGRGYDIAAAGRGAPRAWRRSSARTTSA